MKRFNISKRVIVVFAALMIFALSLGVHLGFAGAVSDLECATYCIQRYYVPNEPASMDFVWACIDGCLYGSQQ